MPLEFGLREALFLTYEYPFPPRAGGQLRDASIVSILSKYFHLEIAFVECKGTETPLPLPNENPKNILVQKISLSPIPTLRRVMNPFLPHFINNRNQQIEEFLRSRQGVGKLLWLSRLRMARYLTLAKSLGYQVILDEHNIESILLFDLYKNSIKGILIQPTLWLGKVLESHFCKKADIVFVPSRGDLAALEKLSPMCNAFELPNCIDVSQYESSMVFPKSETRGNLLFTGKLNYFPNIQGLIWFVKTILPELRRLFQGDLPRITVAGGSPGDGLANLLREHQIQLIANPPEMVPLLREASTVFVPLLAGSGTRLKILEAMASRRPIVTTKKGVEGIDAHHEKHLLIADEPHEFARSLFRLFSETDLVYKMTSHSFDLVNKYYSWQALEQRLKKVLELELELDGDQNNAPTEQLQQERHS